MLQGQALQQALLRCLAHHAVLEARQRWHEAQAWECEGVQLLHGCQQLLYLWPAALGLAAPAAPALGSEAGAAHMGSEAGAAHMGSEAGAAQQGPQHR